MFSNNKSFRSKSFVLSAPEINLSPTALTMLTRASVQFLFDSCLISVQLPPRFPPGFLFNPRRIFCLTPVKLPLNPLFFSSISSPKRPFPSLSQHTSFPSVPCKLPLI
ncbi:hypothetical protein BFAG_04479 [Bacteroides fragilis 3_1_12]|uniref:Uncharacterized protein n=1 Tax=Bacteroides fragilis 3_1_12 TaxID=457424 RepID=A0ABN0BSI1_BACFG|nr:hypothetical protein BFAG_04479 [Bacteroides fragilis 3_1_12]